VQVVRQGVVNRVDAGIVNQRLVRSVRGGKAQGGGRCLRAREVAGGAMVGAPGDPGNGQAIYIAVDDPDALCARAEAAGATILMALTDTDYGSRDFICRDPEGYVWCFGTYWPQAHEPA
jgi:uncharacterized glyoxalase superfamily protein PhnB